MTTTVIIDVIVGAVLLGFVIRGAYRGMLQTLAGLVILVMALVGASIVAKTFTAPVTDFLSPIIEKKVEQRVDRALGGSSSETAIAQMQQAGSSSTGTEDGTASVSAAQSGSSASSDGSTSENDPLTRLQASQVLKLMGLDESIAEYLSDQVQEKVHDTGVSLATAVVESLAQTMIYGLLFAVSFVLLSLMLNALVKAMDLVFRLPGLHLINSLGGATIGLAEGALMLFLAIWVLRCFGVSFETPQIEQTRLLSFFAAHSPLDLLLFF